MAKYRDSRFAAWAEQQFNWNIQPKLIDLAVDDARINLAFGAQRDLDGERAAGMAEHYLPAAAAGASMAELPNGDLVFMDGQHRWKAAKDAGVKTIWALSFEMSYEQAAAFFRLKNGPAIKLVRHIESTRAGMESTDPRFLHMKAILELFDCFLANGTSSKQEGAVNASSMTEKVYEVDNGELLVKTLEVITESWGHAYEVLTGPILQGVALFIAHHHDMLRSSDVRELKDKLAKRGFEDLWAQARSSFKRTPLGASQSAHVEQEIVVTYNLRRTSKRLPERSARQLRQLPDLAQLATANQAPRKMQTTLPAEGQEVS